MLGNMYEYNHIQRKDKVRIVANHSDNKDRNVYVGLVGKVTDMGWVGFNSREVQFEVAFKLKDLPKKTEWFTTFWPEEVERLPDTMQVKKR